MIRTEASGEHCEGAGTLMIRCALWIYSRETLRQVTLVVRCPSDLAVLMASAESGGQEVQEACGKFPVRLPGDVEWQSGHSSGSSHLTSRFHPSLHLLSTFFINPTTPCHIWGNSHLIRVLMPGTSGLMARLRKTTLGARGQSPDGRHSTSPDHILSLRSLRSILKRVMWVISAGSFQGCCSPVGISFGYIAQKTQEKKWLKALNFPLETSLVPSSMIEERVFFKHIILGRLFLVFFQTHTPYPSFRETFLGALNASAHVLLVTCSPHVAR